MAITKKAISIQEGKAFARSRIAALQVEVRSWFRRVPKSVVAADAVSAANWRDVTADLFSKDAAQRFPMQLPAKSASLDTLLAHADYLAGLLGVVSGGSLGGR